MSCWSVRCTFCLSASLSPLCLCLPSSVSPSLPPSVPRSLPPSLGPSIPRSFFPSLPSSSLPLSLSIACSLSRARSSLPLSSSTEKPGDAGTTAELQERFWLSGVRFIPVGVDLSSPGQYMGAIRAATDSLPIQLVPAPVNGSLSPLIFDHHPRQKLVRGAGVLERWLHPDRLFLIDADRGTSGKFAL